MPLKVFSRVSKKWWKYRKRIKKQERRVVEICQISEKDSDSWEKRTISLFRKAENISAKLYQRSFWPITRITGNSTTKSLMRPHLKLVGNTDTNNSGWARTLFYGMGFRYRKTSTFKLAIRAGVGNEAELLFHRVAAEKVENHDIPRSLVIISDWTLSQYVPVASTSLRRCNSKQVYVKDSNNERLITVTY